MSDTEDAALAAALVALDRLLEAPGAFNYPCSMRLLRWVKVKSANDTDSYALCGYHTNAGIIVYHPSVGLGEVDMFTGEHLGAIYSLAEAKDAVEARMTSLKHIVMP